MLQKLASGLPAIATGLRSAWREGYGLEDLRKDALAGLTVGTIAVPLSMALAIATGVPPQHGLYTAIVAGALIPLLGGSHVQVSGPTAAFVVILAPIASRFGVAGLLLATAMAGVLLLAMGLAPTGLLFALALLPNSLWGLAEPTIKSLMSARVSESEQGQLQGASQSVMSLAGILGPVFFGWVYGLSVFTMPWLVFAIGAGVLILAALATARLRDPAPAVASEAQA